MNSNSSSSHPSINIKRRHFLSTLGAAAVATSLAPNSLLAMTSIAKSRIPLGLDAHSIRGMRWKAPKILQFAIDHKMDGVLFNNLSYFESLDDKYLKTLRKTADDHAVQIYMGAGGICANGARFKKTYGDAEDLVKLGIKVATTLGSPIVNVKIGNIKDRFLPGGIQPRAKEAIRVLKACSKQAQDAGIKFGFENHAADLRSEELLPIIKEVGTDVCGAMIDPGNALWAMEDPMVHVKALAPYVVANSVRDYTVWPSEDGAQFQWMAVGEGMMDVKTYIQALHQSNPKMPIFVESISNAVRPLPFLTEAHWEGYPDLAAKDITDFLKLLRKGRQPKIDKPKPGEDKKKFDQQHQVNEFRKSVEYLRKNCDAGLKLK